GSAVQHSAVATCEAGIHNHAVPVTHRPGQIRWFAVHQNYANLGVRDPERLDRVLHCRRPRTAIDDVAIALLAREEFVQLPVKAKRRDSTLHRLTLPGPPDDSWIPRARHATISPGPVRQTHK